MERKTFKVVKSIRIVSNVDLFNVQNTSITWKYADVDVLIVSDRQSLIFMASPLTVDVLHQRLESHKNLLPILDQFPVNKV